MGTWNVSIICVYLNWFEIKSQLYCDVPDPNSQAILIEDTIQKLWGLIYGEIGKPFCSNEPQRREVSWVCFRDCQRSLKRISYINFKTHTCGLYERGGRKKHRKTIFDRFAIRQDYSQSTCIAEVSLSLLWTETTRKTSILIKVDEYSKFYA